MSESAALQRNVQAHKLDPTTVRHESSKEVAWEQRALNAEERCRKLAEELANRTDEVSDKAKALVNALIRIDSLKEDLKKAQQASASPGSSEKVIPQETDVVELSKANMELARELRAKKESAAKTNRKLADTKEELTQVKRKLIETESNLDLALRELERKKNVTAKKSDSYVLPHKSGVCSEKRSGQAATSKHKAPKEASASRKHVISDEKDARLGLKNTWKKASEKTTPQQQANESFQAQASKQNGALQQNEPLAFRRLTGDLRKQPYLPCTEIGPVKESAAEVHCSSEVKWEPLSPFEEDSTDREPPLNSRQGGAPPVLFSLLTMDASDRAPASTQPSLPAESPVMPSSTTPDTRVSHKHSSSTAYPNTLARGEPVAPEAPPREVGYAAHSKVHNFMPAPPGVWSEHHPATWPLLNAPQLQPYLQPFHTAFGTFQQQSVPAASGVHDARPCFSAANPTMLRGSQMATTLYQSPEEQKHRMRHFIAVNTALGISRDRMRRELADTFCAQPSLVNCFDEAYEETPRSSGDAT